MDFNKKGLMAILAMLCVVIAAGSACAADDGQVLTDSGNGDVVGDNNNNAQEVLNDNSDDVADDISDVDNGLTGEGYDGSQGPDVIINGDIGNETVTNSTGNATGNITCHASGEALSAVSHNDTNSTGVGSKLSQYATGNPILVLLIVIAVIGCVIAVKRR